MEELQPHAVPLLRALPALNDRGVRRKLLASHLVTRLGTQGWLFVAPLVLTRFTPESILGPALWGVVTMLPTAFLGPGLGTWADLTRRDLVVTCGVALQFVAVVGATAVILVALAQGVSEEPNWSALWLFTGFSVFEKLGTLLSDVSVKREWVPQLFAGVDQKSLNSTMSQIDLATVVVGPFLAGLLISCGELVSNRLPSFIAATDFGFVATGLLNALSFWPQIALLRSIYHSHAEYLQPVPAEKSSSHRGPVPPEGAWGTWCKHPGGLRFLSSSYALLHLTVLSPHGAILTAFLQLRGVASWQLSLMRGAGALLGIAGTMCRPALGRALGSRTADGLSVCWLAAWMAVVQLTFQAAGGSGVAALGGLGGSNLTLMAAVCMGRPGLYAFELGVLGQEQDLVDQRHRSAIGAVDAALTALGTVAMYASGMYFSGVAQFGILVNSSAFFVALGAATYLAWTALYRSKQHCHAEEDGHGHSQGHTHGHSLDDHAHHEHTRQMEEMKEACKDGYYFHEHVIYEPGNCVLH